MEDSTFKLNQRSIGKENSIHGEMRKALLDMSGTKFPVMGKTKTLGRKRNVHRGKQLLLITIKKSKSMQHYIWFHSCKLDFIHVTIAYAIR